MKRRRFSFKKFALFMIVLIILLVVCFLGIYKFEISSTSKDTSSVSLKIEKGDNYYNIAKKLKGKKLIKSEFFYKLYLKMHTLEKLDVGYYKLNRSMDVAEIVETLGVYNPETVKLTFREGLNIRQIASIIEKKTNIKGDTFIEKVSDENYINSLKEKYWFITDDVKNSNIYYDLEGYLYPDTYIFEVGDLSLENIIIKMLDNTDSKLKPLQADIEKNNYSVHQILTLASLVELEAVTDSDRANVAGVFYNRLNNGWSLGSDVTTYYAAKKSMKDSLTTSELNDCNGYNTRCTSMKTLPVGPIDNPSLSSIKAALYPSNNNYYYFVTDSEKKVYFTKNANEHEAIIAKLKKEGKWIG